jgi:hypothetical protein
MFALCLAANVAPTMSFFLFLIVTRRVPAESGWLLDVVAPSVQWGVDLPFVATVWFALWGGAKIDL